MRPTRFDLTLEYAREFITEWFDQNPLGQIGIVGMRGGIGERIGEMSGAFFSAPLLCSFFFLWEIPTTLSPPPSSLTSLLFLFAFFSVWDTWFTCGGRYDLVVLCPGNPQDVLRAISERHKLEPVGEPSLQNAIEMARSSMRFVSSLHPFYTPMADHLTML